MSDFFNSILNNPEITNYILHDRFLLVALVIFLIRVKYATYRSMWLSALVNIPGTFLHELCHFIVGLITNARPIGFSVWPKETSPGCYTMGSVRFQNIKFYNAIPSAMAPLLLLPFGFWLNRNSGLLVKPDIWHYIGYVFLQTIIIENAMPSSTDFKVAFRNPLGILLFMALGLILFKLDYINF